MLTIDTYSTGSKKRMAAERLATTIRKYGFDRSQRFHLDRAESDWAAEIGTVLIYTKNVNGSREPNPLWKQREQFRRDCRDTYAAALEYARSGMPTPPPPGGNSEGEGVEGESDGTATPGAEGAEGNGDDTDSDGSEGEGSGEGESDSDSGDGDESESEGEGGSEGDESEGEGDESESDSDSEGETESQSEPQSPEDRIVNDHVEWSRMVRTVLGEREADGRPVDDWGMRPTLDGISHLLAGIPRQAVRDHLTMHLPTDVRRQVGVKSEYDARKFKGGIMGYLLAAAQARTVEGNRVPLCLIGGKGTGKTSLAKELAIHLFGDEDKFGMVSMTTGTPPSAFYGRPKVGGDGGVIESLFVRYYRDGGVFLFDEMDASDPNLLLIVNAALANGIFANPATGERVKRSPDFLAIAAMNTHGLGATAQYAGRERLDAASLDRFACGRVRIPLDESLEDRLVSALRGDDNE